MTTPLWSTAIAVPGTLGGGLVAGVVQARASRTTRRETRIDARRAEALAAVTALVSALADHRRAMWVREDLRLARGDDDQQVASARSASHNTRSAITGPLISVGILVPSLSDPARHAVDATYALRDAADREALTALRDDAVAATDRLIEEAGQFFSAAPASTGRWPE